MLSSDDSPEHRQLKTNLITAREQLSIVLGQYAEICRSIRNTHHQASSRGTQTAGFPWSELASEIPFLSSLNSRLQEAAQDLNRAYELGQAKSSSVYPPSIDRLPDEILTQIFRFAVNTQLHDARLAEKKGTISFPRLSDVIAHTCTRWRRVSLICSSLWTQIYLAPHPTRFESLLDHAKSYAQRAGQLPLKVYLTNAEGQSDSDTETAGDEFQAFVASIAPRTTSLEVFRSNSFISGIENQGFAGILRGSSEIFTRLVIRFPGAPWPGFILHSDIGPDEDENPEDVTIGLSRQQIEHGLEHLTVLHASKVYPQWNSVAYHGLVDLRLTSNHKNGCECPTIEPSEFTAILAASPRLRILHFGINLEYAGNDAPMNYTSVQLKDLEVLCLSASYCYGSLDTEHEIQRIMMHITPGSKPLHLTLELAVYYDPEVLETMKAFFSKAHIVTFCSKKGSLPPVELLDCAPHLTRLIFDQSHYDTLYNFNQAQSSVIRLDSWIIQGSSIFTEDLELLVKQYHTAQAIVLSNCRLFDKNTGLVEIEGEDLENWIHHDKPNIVQYLKGDFLLDPIVDWENFG